MEEQEKLQTFEQVHYSFAGLLEDYVGKNFAYYVCETLCYFTPEETEKIQDNITFLAPHAGAWAYTSNKKMLKENLIVLNPLLLKKKPKQIMFTIAHEIGHVFLKHKGGLEGITNEEWKKQEKEADSFAKKHLGYFDSIEKKV